MIESFMLAAFLLPYIYDALATKTLDLEIKLHFRRIFSLSTKIKITF
jgi:hypothetical protein